MRQGTRAALQRLHACLERRQVGRRAIVQRIGKLETRPACTFAFCALLQSEISRLRGAKCVLDRAGVALLPVLQYAYTCRGMVEEAMPISSSSV